MFKWLNRKHRQQINEAVQAGYEMGLRAGLDAGKRLADGKGVITSGYMPKHEIDNLLAQKGILN